MIQLSQDHQQGLIPIAKSHGKKVFGGGDRLEGKKPAKRKGKEKADNTIVKLVISHFKDFSTNISEMMQIFKDLPS